MRLLTWVMTSNLCLLPALAAPSMNVWLKSNWAAPPILLEALETAYIEDPSIYFPLLNALLTPSSISSLSTSSTDQQRLTTFLAVLNSSSLPVSHPDFDFSSFHTSLALHAATPKLEAYYTYYESNVEETLGATVDVKGEDAWVEWGGRGWVEVEALKRAMEMAISGEFEVLSSINPPRTLSFDHIYPPSSLPSSDPSLTAVLYISSLTSHAATLVSYLERHAIATHGFRFIVRYRPEVGNVRDGEVAGKRGERGEKRNSLGGYGVEMVLKRTDYLAVDDRATGGELDRQGVISRPNVTASAGDDWLASIIGQDPWKLLETPLRATEIADLGLRTASLILSSPTPFNTFLQVTQSFPLYSAAIARHVPLTMQDERLAREVLGNQERVRMGSGFCGVWVNGRAVSEQEMDAFSFLDIVRTERKRLVALTGLGLTPSQAQRIISDTEIGQGYSADVDPMAGLVDASDRREGGGVVLWWNDVEKDKKYAAADSSLSSLWRPTQPGGIQAIKKNIWNMILVLDFSQRTTAQVLYGTIGNLIRRGLTIRFGVVPLLGDSDEDESAMIGLMIEHVLRVHGKKAAMEILQDMAEAGPPTLTEVTAASAERIYTFHLADEADFKPFKEIIAAPKSKAYLEKARAWSDRVAARKQDEGMGHVFFNGKYSEFDESWTQKLQYDYMAFLSYFLKPETASVNKKLKKVDTFFYDLPTTSVRRNALIAPGTKNPLRVVDMSQHLDKDSPVLREFIYPDSNGVIPLTTWIITDVNSVDGRLLLTQALGAISIESSKQRIGVIHLSSSKPSSTPSTIPLSTFLYQLYATSTLDHVKPQEMIEIINSISSSEPLESSTDGTIVAPGAQHIFQEGSPLHALTSAGWSLADSRAAEEFWTSASGKVAGLGVVDGKSIIVINGRIIGPLQSQQMLAEDFEALADFEWMARTKTLATAIASNYEDISSFDRGTFSNLIAGISSVVSLAYTPSPAQARIAGLGQPRRDMHDLIETEHSAFTHGDRNSSLVSIFAILDPISEKGQKWAGLLKMAIAMDHIALTAYINPTLDMTEVPVKRFYRYEGRSQLSFDVDGDETPSGPSFGALPGEPIFTLGMDVPSSWLVSPRRSVHDLDNLRLDAISGGDSHAIIDFSFELEQLVIDGHARESDVTPPRGLQLQLTQTDEQVIADTQVMANLGYFQFRANPGVMQLSIRAGRGREVYTLVDMDTKIETPAGLGDPADVALTSFSGTTIFPVFKRNPGMEMADVLSVDQKSVKKTFLSQIVTSISTVLRKKPVVESKKAEINIFTVASGMLYERFASIMILSVMRHTKSTVKFWFIENFLSPSFLEFIPFLAEEYGFQYELVTYKWPSWLRGQKEKQRTIWGYKILFLDVLFPMDLDKVIFVDADQIVRTDMKNLVDVDLKGRVYGYAPMGDDKEEMEGFRFWKKGYWKDALRGKPYHISALYVVDLDRFRQMAAGDQLRATYQQLSADPNSLSNLDQDLPNSMQDRIPIHTLDQSWLWCETWCSKESLKDAKTIDLCQNPLTKEPKLDRARSIPEWESYDNEIATFAKGLAERKRGSATISAGKSVEEMAGVAPVAEKEDVDEAEESATDTQDDEGERKRVIDEL